VVIIRTRRQAPWLSLLSVLAAAFVVFTAFSLSARSFQPTRLDDGTDRLADISGMRVFVELDEEREHVSASTFVEVPHALRLIPHGLPATSTVGPAQGHPPTSERPPSAL